MKKNILYLLAMPFIFGAIPFGFIFEAIYAGFHAGRSALNKLPKEGRSEIANIKVSHTRERE
jgi:hypothetical protein